MQEKVYWKQRAKMQWIRDGDLNTEFFHMSATTRKKFKSISIILREDNEEMREHAGLCEVAKQYFKILFAATNNSNYDLVLDNLQQRITREDNDELLVPISKG